MPAAQAATVSGTLLMSNGELMDNGIVVFFDALAGPPPLLDKYFRMPEIVEELDSKSVFRVSVPAGEYYIGARKSQSLAGEVMTPIKGDYLLIVKNVNGVPKKFTVKSGQRLDVGTIYDGFVYGGQPMKSRVGATGVLGTLFVNLVTHLQGVSVVAAKVDGNGQERSKYVAAPSGEDGTYLILLPEDGTYHLRLYGGSRFVGRFDIGAEVVGQKVVEDYVKVTVSKGQILPQTLFTVGP